MRLPVSWIQSCSSFEGTKEDLAQLLHRIGFELDERLPQKLTWSKIRVGKILDCLPHPDASRLKVAQVQVDLESPPRTIVCGAPNCRAGLIVACALPGEKLPGFPEPLKTVKLRGILSEGMLCSAEELGLPSSFSPSGLWELPQNLPVGSLLAEHLEMDEEIWNLPLPANRPDCHSVLGLAREIAGCNLRAQFALGALPLSAPDEEGELPCSVVIEDPSVRHYTLGFIETDPIGLQSALPPRILQRLAAAGYSVSNLWVALLNLLTLELGQPFHAFDADAIEGSLRVRCARPGEKIELLNGQELIFDESCLPTLIADDAGPLCLAGIMGGQRGKIVAGTRRILLESAEFDPKKVAEASQATQVISEASLRFERGLEPNFPGRALTVALQRLSAWSGHQQLPSQWIWKSFCHTEVQSIPWMRVRMEKYEGLIGSALDRLERFPLMLHALERLGMEVRWSPEGRLLEVRPPSWRQEIQIEEDLIEVLARLQGYENLEAQPLSLPLWPQATPQQEEHAATPLCGWKETEAIRQFFCDLGFFEIKNLALTSKARQRLLVGQEGLEVPNPLSQNLDALRCSLIPGLIGAAQHNQARHSHSLKLFEVGSLFEAREEGIQEIPSLGLLFSPGKPLHWRENEKEAQTPEERFFTLKSDLERWLQSRKLSHLSWSELPALAPWVAPSQGLALRAEVGLEILIGNLHPAHQTRLGLKQPVTLCEVLWRQKIPNAAQSFQVNLPFPLPTTRRMVTLVIRQNLSSIDWMKEAQAALKPSFEPDAEAAVGVASVYLPPTHQKISEAASERRISFNLTIQGRHSNLSETEIEKGLQRWLKAMHERCGATLARPFPETLTHLKRL